MAQIQKPYTFYNGQKANATEVNANFDTIVNYLNGNIEDDNIKLASIDKNKLKQTLSEYFQDPVSTYSLLPATPKANEIRFVEDEKATYVYDLANVSWTKLNGAVAPLNYQEIDGMVEQLDLISDDLDLIKEDITELENNKVAKGSIVINAKDHGVKGDGITDDTAAIQVLLDTLPTPSVLFFPQGTYIVSTLNVNRFVELRGVGRKTVFMRKTGAIGSAVIVVNSPSSLAFEHYEMKDFFIHGKKELQGTEQFDGIQIKGVLDGVIQNIFTYGCTRHGFVITNSVDGGGAQVITTGTKIKDCYTFANDGYGIYVYDTCSNVIIEGGEQKFNKFFGVMIGGKKTTIRDVRSKGTREGIGMKFSATAKYSEVFTSIIEENEQHGMVIEADKVLVDGCKIFSNSYHTDNYMEFSGVYINGCNAVSLNGCFFGDNYLEGAGVLNRGVHKHFIEMVNATSIHIFSNNLLNHFTNDPVVGLNGSTKTDFNWHNSFVIAATQENQAITAATFTNVRFVNQFVDSGDEFDGTTFSPKYPGKYQIDTVMKSQNPNGGTKILRIYVEKNGLEVDSLRFDTKVITTGEAMSLNGSAMFDLKEGEVVKFQFYSSTADTLEYGQNFTRLTIRMIK